MKPVRLNGTVVKPLQIWTRRDNNALMSIVRILPDKICAMEETMREGNYHGCLYNFSGKLFQNEENPEDLIALAYETPDLMWEAFDSNHYCFGTEKLVKEVVEYYNSRC